MTPELITAIAGALIGIGGFVFGIIKWRDERRERRNSKKRQSTQDFVAEKINEAIVPIKDELAKLQETVKDNELNRLRSEIMIFVHELKNGQFIDGADFEHIHKAYDRYHAMGGNSYIDGDMQFILRCEKEILKKINNNNNNNNNN